MEHWWILQWIIHYSLARMVEQKDVIVEQNNDATIELKE